MASTFTGLKLQGDIGRFGKRETSPIERERGRERERERESSPAERESTLLIWDGGLIRAVLVRPDGEGGAFKPCHEGMIEVVRFDEQTIVTVLTIRGGSRRVGLR